MEPVEDFQSVYGVSSKIVKHIEKLYDCFECSIILDGAVTEYFEVKSRIRHGCIDFSILFPIVIDWVMYQSTSDHPPEVQWILFSYLEDLAFADDLSAISSNRTHLKEKSYILNVYGNQTGLHISKQSYLVMNNSAPATSPIIIDGEALEHVKEFTYLT